MIGWILTEATPANVLKLSGCCLHDGRIYRCIRRAATITLADVETGAVRDVAGVDVITRAVPASVPGALLGHVSGKPITAEIAPAGVLVLIRTGWRWELARAEPTPFAFKGRQMRNFRAVTPWQRSPTRFRVPIDAPCWLAVPVAEVALKHAKARPVARPRPSRARPVSEHAPRKRAPAESQVVWGKSKPKPTTEPAPPAQLPEPPLPKGRQDLPWAEDRSRKQAPLPPLPEGWKEWFSLKRTTKDLRQETLLFETSAEAKVVRLQMRSEQDILLLRGIFATETTHDGLLRAYLAPRKDAHKNYPKTSTKPAKARPRYNEDDDKDEDDD